MRVAIGAFMALVCALPAAAQERQFGAKIGPTFATAAIAPDGANGGYGVRTAVAGGGFLVLPARARLALQIEALFSPRGATLDLDDENIAVTLQFDYLELPVLARVTAIRASGYSLHLFGGPSGSIRMSAKQRVSTTGPGFAQGFNEDISADVARFDAGLIAGAGVDVGSRWLVDGRYYWGLTDINRGPDDAKIRTRALTITGGVRF